MGCAVTSCTRQTRISRKKAPGGFSAGGFPFSVQSCADPAEEDPRRPLPGGRESTPPAPHAVRGEEPAPPVALVFTCAAHAACRHTPCVCMSAPPSARNARGSSSATVRISISAPPARAHCLRPLLRPRRPLHPCALPVHPPVPRRPLPLPASAPIPSAPPPPARRAQAQRVSPPAGGVERCRKR